MTKEELYINFLEECPDARQHNICNMNLERDLRE